MMGAGSLIVTMIPFVSVLKQSRRSEIPGDEVFKQQWARISFLIPGTIGICLSLAGCLIGFLLLLRQHRAGGCNGLPQWSRDAGCVLTCIAFGMLLMSTAHAVWSTACLIAHQPTWLCVTTAGITAIVLGFTTFAAANAFMSCMDEGDDVDVFDMNDIHVEMAKKSGMLNDDAGGF